MGKQKVDGKSAGCHDDSTVVLHTMVGRVMSCHVI